MGFKSWIASFEAVGFEELGYLHCVGLLAFYADCEGFHAAEEEPGVEGGETAAGRVDGEVEFLLSNPIEREVVPRLGRDLGPR